MPGFTPAPVNGGNALELSGDVNTDPLDWLAEQAPQAAEKLRNLRQRNADLHELIPEFESRQQANLAKVERAGRLARLMAHPATIAGTGLGFGLAEDDPRVVAEQKKLDGLTKAAERINALYEKRSQEWQEASRPLAGVEAYLRGGKPPGTIFQDLAAAAPKSKNGESQLQAIERIRKRVGELKAELADVERRAPPASWTRQRAREQIEALAQRGRPSVSAHLAKGPIQFATERHSHPLMATLPKGTPVAGVCAFEAPDMLGLFCWLNKTALVAALDREIAGVADDDTALLPDQREKATAKIGADLLDLERQEAALVWQAIEQKLPAEFRGDTDPRAVLSIEPLIVAPAAAAATRSIGDHVFDLVGLFGGRS